MSFNSNFGVDFESLMFVFRHHTVEMLLSYHLFPHTFPILKSSSIIYEQRINVYLLVVLHQTKVVIDSKCKVFGKVHRNKNKRDVFRVWQSWYKTLLHCV